VAVAHHQPTPVLVELIDQRIDIGIGLGLQRGGQHPPGTLPRDLIQQRPRRHIARRHLTRAACLNYLKHGRTFPTSVAAPALLDTNMATGKVRPARPQPQVSSIALDAAMVLSNDSDLHFPLEHARTQVPVATINPSTKPTARDLRSSRDVGVGQHWWRRLRAEDFFDHQLPNTVGAFTKPKGW